MPPIKKPPDVAYPPVPWRFSGQLWMGVFRTEAEIPLPAGLHHVLSSRWLVVTLVRYLDGTLQYDEFAVGPLARRGAHIGIFVDRIWVNDVASLSGGRRIWGLPKQLADFGWDGDAVRITDEDGLVGVLRVARHATPLPVPWMPAPGFGRVDEQWAYTLATMRARLGRGGLRVREWSDRFPYRPGPNALASVAAKPFRMTVPPPRLLGAEGRCRRRPG